MLVGMELLLLTRRDHVSNLTRCHLVRHPLHLRMSHLMLELLLLLRIQWTLLILLLLRHGHTIPVGRWLLLLL